MKRVTGDVQLARSRGGGELLNTVAKASQHRHPWGTYPPPCPKSSDTTAGGARCSLDDPPPPQCDRPEVPHCHWTRIRWAQTWVELGDAYILAHFVSRN